MKDSTDTRPQVRIKPRGYQPSKADLEEPFLIRRADGTVPTPEEVARVALQPMRIVEDPEA